MKNALRPPITPLRGSETAPKHEKMREKKYNKSTTWRCRESNPESPPCESNALTTPLQAQLIQYGQNL